MKNFIILLCLNLPLLQPHANAACLIEESNSPKADLLSALLEASPECPQDVRELKNLLVNDGLKSLPAMVANRGFHNSKSGSFSIFESVMGSSTSLNKHLQPEHFYFGHFTALSPSKEIILDQKSAPNKLLIEAIAYDFGKGVYNFYELVGTAQGPRWFYRGNSFDAYADNKLLKISNRPQFGTHMRCSACHASGGPIMKELSSPHNDWWTKSRGLPFGLNKPSQELKIYMKNFIDASVFSKNVMMGMKLLERAKISQRLSLKEKLRPLFCTTEINLKSDTQNFASPSSVITISSDAFVDALLTKSAVLSMRKSSYVSALSSLGSKFPESNQLDADHPFLVPVRSEVNQLQVKQLIDSRIIDEEFSLDVLSVDFKNPLFSKKRCDLLKLIPEGGNWKESFKKKLLQSRQPEALELASKLELVDGELHRAKALNYLQQKENSWSAQPAVIQEVKNLNALRLSVFKDEISQNPKGQILEPGFRVIFPVLRPW
jgi:hypothetical protein